MRRHVTQTSAGLVWLAAGLLAVSLTRSTAAVGGDPSSTDIPKIEQFLHARFPNKTWATGPTRIDSPTIRAAYSALRFYYVFTPTYPVGVANGLSQIVSINNKGIVKLIGTPVSYNNGLMKVGDEKTAQTAGAAIMSLTLGPFGPVSVAPDVVTVRTVASTGGWRCVASFDHHQFLVAFNSAGKCVMVNHNYNGPLPICVGGQFLPVRDQALARLGLGPDRAALEVISMEEGSIAEKGGLRVGDVLVAFDGKPLPLRNAIQHLRRLVFPLKQRGDATRAITVIRKGESLTLTLRWEPLR